MTPIPVLSREDLFKALGDNPRLIKSLEQLPQVIGETQDATVGNQESTQAIQDATVITLAPNDTFNNERVLKVGSGIKAVDDGKFLTLTVSDDVPHVEGGFRVGLSVSGDTELVLPIAGVLATVNGAEKLTNKTLDAPKLSTIGNYASDAAAAAGGVAVGQIYRNGSALNVRIS